MGEGHVGEYKKTFRLYLTLGFLWYGLLLLAAGYLLVYESIFDDILILGALASLLIISGIIFASVLATKLTKPTEYLAQAILHVSPNEHLVAAPNIDQLRFGRELVATLTRQIYDFATTAGPAPEQKPKAGTNEVFDALPVAVIGINETGAVTMANQAAQTAFGPNSLVGLNLDSQIQMEFPNNTINDWLADSRQKSLNAQKSWHKVTIRSGGGETKNYYDIAGIFRQHHPSGTETILVFFDHSEAFAAEADAMRLIALAVHELRTPLTILRGYVEVLQEDLEGKLEPDLQNSMDRMSSSAENLAAFVSNILSVARADENQLVLKLQEQPWSEVIAKIIADMETRAAVRGKHIELTVAQVLPTVAVDRISIAEVITNLVDNAIKYSPDTAKTIWVDSRLDTDGSVLTTVRDEGVGIPDSVVPNLFAKFYRNHRNSAHVAGTGLGLYLSKAIVTAHHGNIWVKSKEGVGTTIGFTILPYDNLAEAYKKDDNGITRTSHGWIKNHSMQRR